MEGYKKAVDLRPSHSLLALFLGGIFAVWACNGGRPTRVQCNKCGAFFDVRTRGSRVSVLLFWLLVAPAILVLAAFLFITLRALFVG